MTKIAKLLTRLVFFLTVGSGLPYIVPAAAQSEDGPSSRPYFPDITLIDGSGIPFHLSRYLGAVIVLEFGASNCGPCVKELPYLDRLQGDYPKLPLKVFVVSEDQAGVAAEKQFLQRQKLSYLKPFADPGASAAQALGVIGLPTSFIIDRQGRLVMELQGPQAWDNAAYEGRIKMLLSQP